MIKSFTRILFLLSIVIPGARAFGQSYCIPTFSNLCSSQDYINNFSFKTLVNNNSGCNGNTNNYIHYTTGGPTTSVKRGEPVAFSMQSGSSYYQGFGLWIDYNQDGDFDDAGEFVYASPGASTAVFSDSTTIPNTASLGVTRLRVRCAYSTNVYANQSCTNFAFGETEDYDITINAASSQVSFTASKDSTCINVPVTFTNTSTDPARYRFRWNFGDGTTLTDTLPVSVTHTFTSASDFTVRMYVYDNTGNFLGSSSRVINVQPGTNGWFNMSKDSTCPGDPIYMDPNGNSGFKKWRMSDGWTSTNWWETRTLSSFGTYTVQCICTTNCGIDTITRILKVVSTIPANSAFSMSPNPACPNTQVNFYPNDYSGTHLWKFGDGNSSNLSYAYHKYPAIGTYTVTHKVTNLCGNSHTDTMLLNIVDTIHPTIAGFNFYPNTTVCPGVQITFQSQNYDGQWSWDFGDGNTAGGQYPKHTYAAAGTYTVTHTITNACGKTLSQTATITISGTLAPDTTFTMYPPQACPGDLIGFNPNEQYGKTYLWNFGDGFTSSLRNPSHSYAAPGNYAVKLTIKNYCGITASHTDTARVNGSLHVNVAPTPNVYPQPACPTQPLNFDAGVWGYPKYIWNYGDGHSDTTAVPYIQHSYSIAGTYTVGIKIVNNCNYDTTIYKTVSINSAVPFTTSPLYMSTRRACPGENVNAYAPYGYPSYQWNMGDGSPVTTSSNYYTTYSYSTTGSYPVSVKVTNYCGQDTTYHDTVKVVIGTSFCSGGCPVSAWGMSPSCPNQNVSFSATQGYTWYKWHFSATDSVVSSNYQANHTYTANGTYNYSVTITNFCGVDTTLYGSVQIDNTIQIPSWVNVYPYPDVACPNQEIQFSTDNSYSGYLWNFGDGYSANGTAVVSHSYTATGTYNASVTITNSCGNSTTVSTSVQVDSSATFPSWMSISYNPSPSSCPGSALTLQTQAGYVSYKWIFGDGDSLTTSTSIVTHTYAKPGNYAASCQIVNSCGKSVTLYQTVSISSNVTLNWLDIYMPNNPACPGDVVVMNVNSSYPLSALKLSWNYGDGSPLDTTIGTGSSHVYASPGTYNVILTATNSCGNSTTASRILTINNSSSPQLNPWSFGLLSDNSTINAVCPGDVVVFYFEGKNPDNLWDFGDGNTGVATDVFVRADGVTVTTIKHAYTAPGTYNYSLKLGNHCGNHTTVSKSISVSSGMLISGGFMISPPSSTLGYTTCGLINFVAFGGKSFNWDFGDGNTLSTLSPTMGHAYVNPGNYTVKVTITNGCGNSATYIKTLIVKGIGGASVSTSSVVPPTCNGGANGSVTAAVSGGQAPYQYNWFDNLGQLISTNVTAANLAAGTYTVNVTDNNGCMGSANVTLNNPAAITFTLSSAQTSCGGSTGTASVAAVANGTAPYTYSWANGQTTSVATGLAMGTYSVVVLDSKGCSSSGSASVSENGAVVSLVSTSTVTCNGGNDGAVTINVTGGTSPYAFAWSNGKTTQNVTGLTAGNYSVVVSDNGGCKSTLNATVTQPSLIVVNPTTAQAPTCGNFNGSATGNVTGGNAPYTYLWDSNAASQTTQTATGLPAGTYTVTVSDSHGCSQKGSITLSNANAPLVTAVVTPISCNGMTDGAIDLTVTGGTSPYLYMWNVSPPNQQDQTGLAPGFYFVSIQDAAGCLSVKSFNLTNPQVLGMALSSSPAQCGTPGSAISSPSGGTAPYTYSWSAGNTDAIATGLTSGNYSVLVTDSRGCTSTGTVSVGMTTVPVPICLVTVDSTSTRNQIVWGKPVSSVIDSFFIYREIASQFVRVGAQAYAVPSEFTDMTGGVNPNITSYRYEISVKDHCGGTSANSAPHRTINLSVNPHSPCGYTLFWNDYSGFPVTQYRIWRDSTHTGWKAMDSVSFGTTQWIDNTCYKSTDTVEYFLETDHPGACIVSGKNPVPDASNLNTSKSNIYRIVDSTATRVGNLDEAGTVSIFPNPNNGNFTVVCSAPNGATLRMLDMLGREVSGTVLKQNDRFSVSIPYAKGVYVLKVSTPSGTINKKFVIE